MINREQLVARIAERTGDYKTDVRHFISAYEEVVKEILLDGEDIHLHGFLTFMQKEHSPKSYLNPRTNEKEIVPAKKKIKVKVSSSLNDKLS